jgi:hypothetical protein
MLVADIVWWEDRSLSKTAKSAKSAKSAKFTGTRFVVPRIIKFSEYRGKPITPTPLGVLLDYVAGPERVPRIVGIINGSCDCLRG